MTIAIVEVIGDIGTGLLFVLATVVVPDTWTTSALLPA